MKWTLAFGGGTQGFVWCLSNPRFITIDYGEQLGIGYLGYPIRTDAIDFVSFLDNWLELKEEIGFKEAMVNYWIKGESDEKKAPSRWSVLRNVFHIGK